MTAKRGMLWKTPWNRGRKISGEPPSFGKMNFFTDFGGPGNSATYATAVNSTLGAALPFWFGIVGMRYAIAGLQNPVNAKPTMEIVTPGSAPNIIGSSGVINGTFYDVRLDVPGTDFLSAAIVRVFPSGAGYKIHIFLADQVSQFIQVDLPWQGPTQPLSIFPGSSPLFHGLCGGDQLPTVAEMQQWFDDLRANLAMQQIPGKTTHFYSAASVVGVPGVLPNGGSAGAAQDMTLTTVGAPTPANLSFPVRFAW